ncbi:glycosyltransferase family 4 protein [Roseobacter sp. YSTF-M11]|uniref:Glycosyltransferase family 4 protein n=1 Tax=Roseobacter insulae TaxID=2859783 RepID=A0A9X1FZZ4_9RHOB|nr:glycosyltransferase family 4 protein [Roseobacter insulae]MBW4710796.1 glycosyltransferase family 4 protein [Roseobacter insulae]
MTHPALPRIAYLTGQYPEVSLTFILREVEALRALGMEVQTCSIRRTPPEQHPGRAEKAAAASTFHVLETLRNPLKFLAAQMYLLRQPGRYFRALRLALQTRAPGLRALVYQIIFFLEATVLAHHLKREKITHLHNHFVFGSATVAMLVSELTDIDYSFTLHGPADLFEPYRWRIDAKTARAKFVSTISHYARSQLMFFSDPSHWHKIRIIHCGVTPERYAQPAPALPERRADEIRLVFVGRLAPVKGLRVLLDAMHLLLPDLPQLHLVLVGDGPDRARLEETATPLGDAVTFTGYLSQDDVARAMQAADIFVLPSFAEGVPVVLMEAFASARPVIATQVAGVGELVEEGESGFLVPPGDVETLAARIRSLADDADLRQRMGARGRARVTEDFDIRIEAARLVRLFAEGPGDDIRPDPLAPARD